MNHKLIQLYLKCEPQRGHFKAMRSALFWACKCPFPAGRRRTFTRLLGACAKCKARFEIID